MKVSVVIPVYNVKPYVERCVQSVLRQTYKDIEIILVDDGSTDGSGEICDRFAEDDKRISVVHQENQGLSGARNSGIRMAKGEYIIFLDSDDLWLRDNGLEELVKEAGNKHPDVVVFKHIDIWNSNSHVRSEDYDIDFLNNNTDAHAIFSYLVFSQELRISACFVLVRRQFLIDNDLFFSIGIISEDLFWSLHLWQHVQSVTFVNLDFYGYYHRKNSITTTAGNSFYAYQCYNRIFNYWKEQCAKGCINASAIRVFLADMWVSRGYSYYRLKEDDRPKALAILKQHTDLLEYSSTKKSKRTARMLSLIGVQYTVLVLSIYWRLRLLIVGHKIDSSID